MKIEKLFHHMNSVNSNLHKHTHRKYMSSTHNQYNQYNQYGSII